MKEQSELDDLDVLAKVIRAVRRIPGINVIQWEARAIENAPVTVILHCMYGPGAVMSQVDEVTAETLTEINETDSRLYWEATKCRDISAGAGNRVKFEIFSNEKPFELSSEVKPRTTRKPSKRKQTRRSK